MKKGWRNDPLWVAHYRERDERRLEREFRKSEIEAMLEQHRFQERLEDATREMGFWGVS